MNRKPHMQKRLNPGQITFIHSMLLSVLLVKMQRPNFSTAVFKWAVSLMPLTNLHQLIPIEYIFNHSCCCFYVLWYSLCNVHLWRCFAWKFRFVFLWNIVKNRVLTKLVVLNKRNLRAFLLVETMVGAFWISYLLSKGRWKSRKNICRDLSDLTED